jgi:DnaK suppressor protein
MTTKRLLTEAEILKMSDKDYMNEDQLAFFKNKLEQLQAEILRNAGQTTENLRETVIVPDPADRATIEEEHALELRTRDRERKLLKKVQQSLARIESGEYGWCEETGEPIGIPRMLARPTATLSLEARNAANCARSCSATERLRRGFRPALTRCFVERRTVNCAPFSLRTTCRRARRPVSPFACRPATCIFYRSERRPRCADSHFYCLGSGSPRPSPSLPLFSGVFPPYAVRLALDMTAHALK